MSVLCVDGVVEGGLAKLWIDALVDIDITHPDPQVDVRLALVPRRAPWPLLQVIADGVRDSVRRGDRLRNLNVASVDLTFFPGEKLARLWLAIAWASYLQHEALELVTWRGERVCDPHEGRQRDHDPIRRGFPSTLTRNSLIVTLALAFDVDAVRRLTSEAA